MQFSLWCCRRHGDGGRTAVAESSASVSGAGGVGRLIAVKACVLRIDGIDGLCRGSRLGRLINGERALLLAVVGIGVVVAAGVVVVSIAVVVVVSIAVVVVVTIAVVVVAVVAAIVVAPVVGATVRVLAVGLLSVGATGRSMAS